MDSKKAVLVIPGGTAPGFKKQVKISATFDGSTNYGTQGQFSWKIHVGSTRHPLFEGTFISPPIGSWPEPEEIVFEALAHVSSNDSSVHRMLSDEQRQFVDPTCDTFSVIAHDFTDLNMMEGLEFAFAAVTNRWNLKWPETAFNMSDLPQVNYRRYRDAIIQANTHG